MPVEPINDQWLNPLPRRVVLLVLSFALGSSFCVYGQGCAFLVLVFFLVLIAGCFSVHRRMCFWAGVTFVLGWVWCSCRIPEPGLNDVSRLNSCGLIRLQAEIIEIRNCKNRQNKRILLKAKRVILPEGNVEKVVSGFLSVHLVAAKPGGHGEVSPVNIPSRFLLNDLVEVRAALKAPSTQYAQRGYLTGNEGIFSEAWVSLSAIKVLAGRQSNAADSDIVSFPAAWCKLEQVVLPLRLLLVEQHRSSLGRENGDLLSSMVFGDRAVEVVPEITESFRRAGLSHLLAASGFNLTVVIALLYFMSRCLSQSRFFINAVCFGGLLSFLSLAGPSPSILRAAMICSLGLWARCVHRSLYMPAALAVVFFTALVLDPLAITDVGFQLSYLATAGMVAGVSLVSSMLSWLRRYLPKVFLDVVAGTLAAQSAVLPIQIHYFSRLAPYFLVANLVVAPIVPFITVLGFLSTLFFGFGQSFSCFQMPAIGIDWLLYWPLEVVKRCVYCFSELPGASLPIRRPPLLFVQLYYLALFGFFLLFRLSWLRLGLCLSLLTMFALLLSGGSI